MDTRKDASWMDGWVGGLIDDWIVAGEKEHMDRWIGEERKERTEREYRGVTGR